MGRTKRQARLAFNPLPTSSSPSASAVKEDGWISYANVGYEGLQRKSKRRRVDNHEDDEGKIHCLLRL
jgi:hypothetical protein